MDIITQNSELMQDDIVEIKAGVRLEHYKQLFNKPFAKAGANWVTLCCKNNENTPSLNIFTADMGWKCFSCGAGGDFIDAVEYFEGCGKSEAIKKAVSIVLCGGSTIASNNAQNVKNSTPTSKNNKIAIKPANIYKCYQYTDENNKPAHVNIRFQEDGKRGKAFLQGTAAQYEIFKTGKFCKLEMRGFKRYLYNLPGVRASLQNNNPVYWVEGEKCADALNGLGLVATTSGGANSWTTTGKKGCIDSLADHTGTFYILPDNDSGGYNYAQSVAADLLQAGHKVKVINLQGLKEKEDVCEWLEITGNNKDALQGLVDAAAWLDISINEVGADDLNTFDISQKSHYHKNVDALRAMLDDNNYVVQGGVLKIITGFIKEDKKDGEDKLKKANKIPITTPLANFIAMVTKTIAYDDGIEGNLLNFYEIKGYKNGLIPLKTVQVDTKNFNNMNWVKELWGINAIMYVGQVTKDRVRFIIEMIGDYLKVEHETIYAHTGWRKINNKMCYLHAGGAVGAENIKVDLDRSRISDKLNRYKLPSKDNLQKAMIVRKFLDVASPDITYSLIGVYMLGVMKELLKGVNINSNFTLYLYGATKHGKSTLAALLLNFFGKDFIKEEFPASFKDSIVAIDRKSFILKDVVMVIDDYFPASSQKEKEAMRKVVDGIARLYGDGTARDRGTPAGNIRSGYTARGVGIITGEQRADICQSGNGRLFYVEVKREKVNYFDKLPELVKNKEHFAYFTRLAVQYISDNWDMLQIKSESDFNEITQQYMHIESGRANNTAVFLLLGFNLFLHVAVAVGVLTVDEQAELTLNAYNVFNDLCVDNSKEGEHDAPVNMFINSVSELIASKRVGVFDATDGGKFFTPDNFVGWRDNEYYFLFPQEIYKAIFRHYRDMGIEFELGARTLWKRLRMAGKIESVDAESNTSLERLRGYNGDRALRVLRMPIDVFDYNEKDIVK